LILDGIKSAFNTSDSNDILGILLGGQNQGKQLLTDKEIRDKLLTLFFTGSDTTISALVWSLYWFSRSPNVQSRLLEELNSSPTLSLENIIDLLGNKIRVGAKFFQLLSRLCSL
jgi:cytochrome P450